MSVEDTLLEAARLEPGDDVLVLDGRGLVLGVHERIGDGWVYAVRPQVDELEELLAEAHAVDAAGVAYLVGEPPVLPLPDASVAAAVGRIAAADVDLGEFAVELVRVLSAGGRVAFAGDVRQALESAGFEGLEAVELGGEIVVSGRRG